MKAFLILIFLIFYLSSCQTNEIASTHEQEQPIEVPASHISTDINLPVSDLRIIIDEKLPITLLDEKAIPLNQKSDSLFLTLQRYGTLDMAYRNGLLYLAMPLKVSAAITKKVIGVNVNNRNKPIDFKTVAHVATDIRIADNWDLEFNCQWKGVKWEQEPILRIMGININLTSKVEELLSTHSTDLENIICTAVNEEIDFSKTFENVYQDIQKPNIIARKPFNIYLTPSTSNIRGKIIDTKKDTISISISVDCFVKLGTENHKDPSAYNSLSVYEQIKDINNQLEVYAELFLPYDEMSRKINGLISNQTFSYEGYEINISSDKIQAQNGKLVMSFKVSGDLNGIIQLKGRPEMDEKLNVSFSAFEYEIVEMDEQWVAISDMAIHTSLEEYIEDLLTVNTNDFFVKLDNKANRGIKKSRLGEKMEMNIVFQQFKPYATRITSEGMQVVLNVTGNTSINLNHNIIQ